MATVDDLFDPANHGKAVTISPVGERPEITGTLLGAIRNRHGQAMVTLDRPELATPDTLLVPDDAEVTIDA